MRESNVLQFPAPPVKPGVYLRGQIDYAQIEAVNQSSLKAILISPKHYLHGLEHPKESTDPMRRGTIGHTAVLEPGRLTSDYAVWEDTQTDPETGEIKKRIRRGKVWDTFEVQHAGKIIVRQSDMEAAMGMRDAVARDALARYYLRTGKGQNEATIVWVEPTTGTVCKSRLDRFAVIGSQHYVIDLKGVTDLSPRGFSAQLARMSYHFQAAFYCDAYKATFGVEPAFMIAAVEMSEPHDLVMYQLDEAALDQGRRLYQEALILRQACLDAKSWPGLGQGQVQPLSLPSWAQGASEYSEGEGAADLIEMGLE